MGAVTACLGAGRRVINFGLQCTVGCAKFQFSFKKNDKIKKLKKRGNSIVHFCYIKQYLEDFVIEQVLGASLSLFRLKESCGFSCDFANLNL